MMKLHGGTQRSMRGGLSGMVYVYQWRILDEEMITCNSVIIKLICQYKNSRIPGCLPHEIMGCLPGLSFHAPGQLPCSSSEVRWWFSIIWVWCDLTRGEHPKCWTLLCNKDQGCIWYMSCIIHSTQLLRQLGLEFSAWSKFNGCLLVMLWWEHLSIGSWQLSAYGIIQTRATCFFSFSSAHIQIPYTMYILMDSKIK